MSRNYSFFIDDEAGELVERYERYLSGTAPGYFDVEEMERIVDYYLSYGRTKDSMRAVELGKKLHPASDALDMKRAKIYLATGDTPKALRLLSSLVNDSDTEACLLKTEALAKLRRVEEAAELAYELMQREPDEPDWMAVDLAMIFQSTSDFPVALALLTAGDRFNPHNIDLLFDLAFCHEKLGNHQQAAHTYKRIIDIDSYASEAWFNLGIALFALEQYEECIEAFDYVLAIQDTDAQALLQKGHAYFQMGQWETALEIYTEYTGMVPEQWEANLFIGECYERMENFIRALHHYMLSYRKKPDNYEALIGISICLLEMEQYQECLEYIRRAIDMADNMADAWVYLAEAHVGLGEYDKALNAYHRAIIIDPNQPDTLLEMGNIYMDLADFKAAIGYYERAYRIDATLEFIELFIAVAAYYIGDFNKTVTFLDLAINRNYDAAKLFLEFCPDADKQFERLLHHLPTPPKEDRTNEL